MALSRKPKVIMLLAGLLIFLLFLLLGIRAPHSPSQGKSAVAMFPTQAVTTLAATKQITPQTLFQSDYQLVNVWASWCGVCRVEHQFLNQLAAKDIPLIGLNYRDSQTQAQRYLDSLGDPYQTVIYDPNGNLAIDLGVIGTPETYLVDRHGVILYKHTGVLDQQVWQSAFADYFD